MGDSVGFQLPLREIYLGLTSHQIISAWPSLRSMHNEYLQMGDGALRLASKGRTAVQQLTFSGK